MGLRARRQRDVLTGASLPRIGVYGTRIAGLSHPLVSGAKLSVYALVDDCALPEQVRVSVTTTTGSRSVYWGQPVDGQPPTLLRMGGLASEVGAWLRLELDLQALGLNGGTLTGLELGHVDGRVWFDRVAVWPVGYAVLTSFSSSHGRRISPGTAVTWTAMALGTVTPLQYRFERRNAAGVWSEVQPYGTANAYSWTPAASDTGEGAVRVSVRNAGSLADFEDTRTLELIVGLGDSLVDQAPVGLRERWRRLLGRTTTRAALSLGVGQRLIEAQSVTPPRRVSLYTPELQLMTETAMTTTPMPPIEYEYIWLAGQPLAQITTATSEVAYYFNDHLGTPILQTSSTAAVVWRVEREPYGQTFTHRVGADRHQPLAFPGQEEEGELSYSVFRWYRAGWGRYTQGDPIGAMEFGYPPQPRPGKQESAHNHLYGYAGSNPILFKDPLGLQKCKSGNCDDCPSGYWTVTEVAVTAFGIYGKRWGTATYRCLGSPRTCRFSFSCETVGGGSEIGVGASGGYVGGKDCTCDEDLSGKFEEVEISAGGASIGGTVGPGPCYGASLGAGFGPGATMKSLICDYKSLGCTK
jgi:RHS repeat-associated protein